MEFDGRISRVLPVRCGVSEKTGNEWKILPFVFEFFERPDDRYPDRVMLEARDTNIMAQIGAFCHKDAAGKVVVENDEIKLIREIPVRIGFGHRVKSGQRKDGTTFHINELSLYKFEITNSQQAQQPAAPANTAMSAQQPSVGQQPFQPQVDVNGNPTYDDLPF